MQICLNHAYKRFSHQGKKPKVSIILPIYNAEPYLRECLESVINQTLKNIEIICVNDGSTDNSVNIIKEYAQRDIRISYIDKPNAGYGQTMNCGIAAANGEYIGIVEPDDFIKPDMYETLYNKAKELDLDIVKSDYLQFETINGAYEYKKINIFPDRHYYNRILSPENDEKMLYIMTINPAGIFRRKFLEENNIYHNESPGASYQDNGFFVQTMYQASKIYFMDKPFYCYRQDNPNQSIHQKNKVFAIPDEYEFIDALFEKNKKLEKYKTFYTYQKFQAFVWHLHYRVNDNYAQEYIHNIALNLRMCYENNEVDSNYFSPNHWAEFLLLLDDQKKYLEYFKQIRLFNTNLSKTKQTIVNDQTKWDLSIYKLFGVISFFSIRRSKSKCIYKILGMPLWKVKIKSGGKKVKYYLLGIPLLKVQQK